MAISGQIILPYGDAPPNTPSVGKLSIYPKNDKNIYVKTDDNNEYALATFSGIISDHGALAGLSDDDHTQYLTEARGDARYYTETEVDSTISGISNSIPLSFLDLNDVPIEYLIDRHLIATASGLEFAEGYISGYLYISSEYNGTFSNGSILHPFKNILEAATYVMTTFSGVGSYAVVLLPGIHYVSFNIETHTGVIKAIIGSDTNSVTLKPDSTLLGTSFCSAYVPILYKDLTVDATDFPEFLTNSGTCCFEYLNTNEDDLVMTDHVIIKGFHTSLKYSTKVNSWNSYLGIQSATVGADVGNGATFRSTTMFTQGCLDKHLYFHGGSYGYISSSEICSSSTHTLSGTAIYAEDNNSSIVIANSNIYDCNKNIIVKDKASVQVFNSVIQESGAQVGIEKYGESSLTIVNSSVPLSSASIYIENPVNVYINAYDSDNNTTTIGKGYDISQTLFSMEVGSEEKPQFVYRTAQDNTFNGIGYFNPAEGTNTEIFTESYNGGSRISARSIGISANDYETDVNLTSNQEGILSGWRLKKKVGANPKFSIQNIDGTDVVVINEDYSVTLNSGIAIDKVLDEDSFASNDPKAVPTQQSTKAYIDNYTYSISELDNGQLDNRYYTETEIDTISGSLNSKIVTDHGSLSGLSDDDHSQYLNSARGDIRYYTKTDLNNGQLDSRYYTEAEVDSKLTTLSGNIVLDHGNLTGLSDDDHTQYLTEARGDARYYTETEIDERLATVSGAIPTYHSTLQGLDNDDHIQYLTTTRGDNRYFTETELNNGQLDTRYYTESEIDTISGSLQDTIDNIVLSTDHGSLSGLIDDDHTQYLTEVRGDARYYTEAEVDTISGALNTKIITDHGALFGLSDDDHTQYLTESRGDNRYYTKTSLDVGQLDTRYYTESEIDSKLLVVSGTLSACQIRRSTNFTVPTSWGNVTFDITDVENDSNVISHDIINTERVNIKETNLYVLTYIAHIQATGSTTYTYSRLLINGTTTISGSEAKVNTYAGEVITLANHFYTNLQANDYVVLQMYTPGTTAAIFDTVLTVAIAKGVKGEPGIPGIDGVPGSGSTILVKDEGATVSGSPHTVLNFIGPTVSVTDAGAGVANITISAEQVFGSYATYNSSDAETAISATTTPQQKVRLTTSSIPVGTYRVGYSYESSSRSTTNDMIVRVQIDDTTNIMTGQVESEDAGADQWIPASGFYIGTFTAGAHNIDMDFYSNTTGYTIAIRRARLEFWRIS